MEKVEQTTLRDLLSERGRLSLKEALHILIKLCDLLIKDRSHGRFHSILTPEQISTDIASVPAFDNAPGKIPVDSPYLSPEIRAGGEPDERGTIWSLGILIMELLTGEKIDQDDPHDTVLPDLVHLRSDIPEDSALMIYRMSERDPDLRIPTLETVKRESEKILTRLYGDESESVSHDVPAGTGSNPQLHRSSAVLFGMTRFIGRTREMTELRRLITETDSRLVTVTGLGGIGKSRIAYELAGDLAGCFRDGIYFVPLNPVRSPALIILAISNALNVTFAGNADIMKQLIRYLREKKILLILDDFDELIEGSGVVLDLLDDAPDLQILVTSRERLNVRSERVYALGGLPVPGEEEDDTVHNSSVELFREHAQRVHPGFSFEDEFKGIVNICTLLEGMPLGIELAASWSRILTCSEIAKEIEENLDFLESSEGDIPERHRGIRATFDRSWELLDEPDRKGLARLSVFRGGFRRDAARDIADVGLEMLVHSVDKSLLRRDAFGRFQVHELIRQYLERKLHTDDDERKQLIGRHSTFYGKFLSDRMDRLWGRDQREVMDEIEVELPNIRLAWMNALSNKHYDSIYGGIEPLYLFHQTRGWFKTCVEFLEDSLKILESDSSENEPKESCIILIRTRIGCLQGLLGKIEKSVHILKGCLAEAEEKNLETVETIILYGISEMARRQGDFDTSVRYAERCLSKADKQKNRRIKASALSSLAMVAQNRGSYKRATELFQKSLQISSDMGYQRGIIRGLNGLGNVYYALGEYAEARLCFQHGREKSEDLGDRNTAAILAGNLGNIAVMLGEYDEAKRFYVERLRNAQFTGDESGIARGLFLLGGVHLRLDELDEAKRVFEKSVDIYKKTNEQRMVAYSLAALAEVRLAQGHYGIAETLLRESLEIYEKIDLKQGIISTLGNIGDILLKRDEISEAIDLLRTALRIAYELKSQQSILTILHRFASLFEWKNDLIRAARLYEIVSADDSSASDHRKEAEESLHRLNSTVDKIILSEASDVFQSTDPVELAEEILDLDMEPHG